MGVTKELLGGAYIAAAVIGWKIETLEIPIMRNEKDIPRCHHCNLFFLFGLGKSVLIKVRNRLCE